MKLSDTNTNALAWFMASIWFALFLSFAINYKRNTGLGMATCLGGVAFSFALLYNSENNE